MPIALDLITHRKLILVRQLYQRALLQAEARHSYVDRILALIVFDLTNETVLKAVVAALDASKPPATDFQPIIQQADNLLAAATLPPVPDKAKIQQVHALRNDAQHKARYPNDTDVSDCRTYTRDFLEQLILNVWGQKFESISLTDVVQNGKVKGYLVEAKEGLAKSDYVHAVIEAEAGLSWTLDKINNAIVGRVPWDVGALVVSNRSNRTTNSREILRAFGEMRDILVRSVIGLDFPTYLRYRQMVDSVVRGIEFMKDGNYNVSLAGNTPGGNDAEFVVGFAINAVIQVGSLVGDIEKPFS
jgi:hypothetical protein